MLSGPQFINGTAGNDVISLQAGASSCTVIVNGVTSQFSSSGVTSITINSESGNDVINVQGTNSGILTTTTSSGTATVNIGNNGSTSGLSGPLAVTNSTARSSTVNVTDSADTRARNVTFGTQPFSGGAQSGTISGLSQSMILFDYTGTLAANVTLGSGKNVEIFQAPASGGTTLNVTGGGNGDVASFVAAGNDVFVGGANQGRLSNTSGYSAGISGVGTVAAYAANANDQANFDLRSAPNSTLVGASGETYAQGANFATYAYGFRPVYAYGKAGDVAQLHPAENDKLVGNPASAYIAGSSYLVETFGFGNSYGYGDVSNVAQFYPGSGDMLVGTSTYGYITGNGYVDAAVGFGNVQAVGNATNTAYFYLDSNYQFVSNQGRNASMTNSNGSFVKMASGFSTVNAFAKDSTDVAFMYDSSGNDTFYGRGSYAGMFSGSSIVAASNFGTVNAYSLNGGTDKLDVASLNYIFNHFGDWQ